jgi:hypothetical protein
MEAGRFLLPQRSTCTNKPREALCRATIAVIRALGTDDGGPTKPRSIQQDSPQQAKYPDTDVGLIAGGHRQARIDCPGTEGC